MDAGQSADASTAIGMTALWEPRAMVGTAVGLRRMIRAMRSHSALPSLSPSPRSYSGDNCVGDSGGNNCSNSGGGSDNNNGGGQASCVLAVPWHHALDTDIRQAVVDYAERSVRFYDPTHPTTAYDSPTHSTTPEVLVSLDTERKAFDYSMSHGISSSSSSSSLPSPKASPSLGPIVRTAALAAEVAEGVHAARLFTSLTRFCVDALPLHAASHNNPNPAADVVEIDQALAQCLDPSLRHIVLDAIYGLQQEGPSGWPDMLALLLTLLRTTTLTVWAEPFQLSPPLQPQPVLDEPTQLRVGGAWLLLEERRALTLDYLSAPLFALSKNVRLFMANYTLAQVIISPPY